MVAVRCDLCHSKFRNIRGLKTHKGRVHKENIPQFDGAGEEPETQCVYTFVSTFAEEDVEYTLKEVLSNDIKIDIISREKVGDQRSAEHLFRVKVSMIDDDWQWPMMNGIQADVIKKLEEVSPFCC